MNRNADITPPLFIMSCRGDALLPESHSQLLGFRQILHNRDTLARVHVGHAAVHLSVQLNGVCHEGEPISWHLR
jgi:hypothetical protein